MAYGGLLFAGGGMYGQMPAYLNRGPRSLCSRQTISQNRPYRTARCRIRYSLSDRTNAPIERIGVSLYLDPCCFNEGRGGGLRLATKRPPSAPIGTPPSMQIALTNQRFVSDTGGVPLRC